MFRGHIVEMGTVEQVLMTPRHPYSKLLCDSIPQADPTKRWTTTVTLSKLEHEEYLRQGCKFAGRCPDVMEICKGVAPADIHSDEFHHWICNRSLGPQGQPTSSYQTMNSIIGFVKLSTIASAKLFHAWIVFLSEAVFFSRHKARSLPGDLDKHQDVSVVKQPD